MIERTLTYTLRPEHAADGSSIGTLNVTVELSAVSEGAPILELRHVAMNVPTTAASIELSARDDTGELPVKITDVGADGLRARQWVPQRGPRGTLTANFRIAAFDSVAALGVAPPIDLRSEEGAISAGAAATLPRPVGGDEWVVRIDWDLSRLPTGTTATSSLGDRSHSMRPAELDQVFFAAGALTRYPPEASDRATFTAAWHGSPLFDVEAMMVWGERLHRHMQEFFDAPDTDYRVFLRNNEVNPGGGIGMRESFVMTFGDEAFEISESELRLTLSHEMFHTFQPMVAGHGGVSDSLAHSWFNEGLAVYYQRLLPWRNGMLSDEEFVEDVNLYAARYGVNPLAQLPNSEVPARFWSDTRVRTLPYDRGFLYFVGVDEALRAAGATSLDELVIELRDAQRSGTPVTPDVWATLMERELGERGVRLFERHLAGQIELPSSGAFGPQFRHVRRRLRRYELGFEPAVLTEQPRIVRGLIEGSRAEAAGLRNGDEIIVPVGQDRLQGDQRAKLTLKIAREGRELEVTYLPRGEETDVTLWELVRNTPALPLS